ncbi:MAG: hypothetical protein NTX22_07235 [Ignavibacteriales bacterium]|nr:hypothetical protein [Ignavibacteriales bacterium]
MINTPQIKNISQGWKNSLLLKVVKYVSIIVGAGILICILTLIFFTDPLINKFLKDKITNTFKEAYPAYTIQLGYIHYDIWKNRLGCDSLILLSSDSSFTCRVASFSASGIGWIKILREGGFTPNNLVRSVIDAQKIVLNFNKSQNELRVDLLHISVPDSEMVTDSIKYSSLIDDERFFAKSKFRQTRFRFDAPQIKIIGLDCLSLLHGNIYKARSININDAFADIFVNMDKLYDNSSPNPQMPNEVLSSMNEIIKVDSIKVINSSFKYRERFAVRAKPGVISFNKVNISISGIANHTVFPDTTIIIGEGLFMNSGTMKLFMAIPLMSKDFSLRYSGSVSLMDVTNLNKFIEAGEHRRIKSGIIQSAKFNIKVKSGQATGTLRVAYKDLSIAVLNKDTGSENGIFDRISSIFGKIFIIRGTNLPDEKGLMKIGSTNYTRYPQDYFLQVLWFALRNGVADVAGFPPPPRR